MASREGPRNPSHSAPALNLTIKWDLGHELVLQWCREGRPLLHQKGTLQPQIFIPSVAHSWGPSGTRRAVAWPQELPADWRQISSFNWPAHMQLVRNPRSLWRFTSRGPKGWNIDRGLLDSLFTSLPKRSKWMKFLFNEARTLVENKLASGGRKGSLHCTVVGYTNSASHVPMSSQKWTCLHLCSRGPGQHHLRSGHLT